MQLTTAERLTYSTVRIECTYKDGAQGTGTGFFFQFLYNENTNSYVPVIITNKHVISNSIHGRLIITKANTNNEPLDTQHFQVDFNNFETFWRKHPDGEVDLCAMPIAPVLNEANSKREKLFFTSLNKSLLPTQQQLKNFSALEEILMVGYPNGIWDNINNKPILRRGITATHPNLNYCGKAEIMIDAACFPGSSGSPVFIFNQGGYQDRIGTYVGMDRVILLGVLYAGPQHTAHGDVQIVNIPTMHKPIAISRIPNNLGLVVKSERILELEELFKE